MKKLLFVSVLVSLFSINVFAAEQAPVPNAAQESFNSEEEVTSESNDSMGMHEAFMGTSESTGGETGGGNNGSIVNTSLVHSSTITAITQNNVTISTPYTYKK